MGKKDFNNQGQKPQGIQSLSSRILTLMGELGARKLSSGGAFKIASIDSLAEGIPRY